MSDLKRNEYELKERFIIFFDAFDYRISGSPLLKVIFVMVI